jgi:transcriptional regulator with XRE-family HTH domain
MVTLAATPDKTGLANLKQALREHGITQEQVADAAGVTRPLVVNVFAGRSTSKNVVETAQVLVAKAAAKAEAIRRKRNGAK